MASSEAKRHLQLEFSLSSSPSPLPLPLPFSFIIPFPLTLTIPLSLLNYIFCVTEQICAPSMQNCTHDTAAHGFQAEGRLSRLRPRWVLYILWLEPGDHRDSLHLLCKVRQALGI